LHKTVSVKAGLSQVSERNIQVKYLCNIPVFPRFAGLIIGEVKIEFFEPFLKRLS
jgi:hypothetical protein